MYNLLPYITKGTLGWLYFGKVVWHYISGLKESNESLNAIPPQLEQGHVLPTSHSKDSVILAYQLPPYL